MALGSAPPCVGSAARLLRPCPHLSAARSVMARALVAQAGKPLIIVRPVSTAQHLEDFRQITAAYLEWLGEDLGFQGIQKELNSLPGSYAPERGGCMLLAYESVDARGSSTAAGSGSAAAENSSSAAACTNSGGGSSGGEVCVGAVALRPLAGHTPTVAAGECVAGVSLESVCEMKRLFVLPGHHGLGVGAALVRALLAEGAALGYKLMVLDTLERLEGANRLYAAVGFQPTDRYNDCPLPGVLYFARRLGEEREPNNKS